MLRSTLKRFFKASVAISSSSASRSSLPRFAKSSMSRRTINHNCPKWSCLCKVCRFCRKNLATSDTASRTTASDAPEFTPFVSMDTSFSSTTRAQCGPWALPANSNGTRTLSKVCFRNGTICSASSPDALPKDGPTTPNRAMATRDQDDDSAAARRTSACPPSRVCASAQDASLRTAVVVRGTSGAVDAEEAVACMDCSPPSCAWSSGVGDRLMVSNNVPYASNSSR
mmetsp:Transcript_90766/g.230952  ORF Transcript_90766/g.230952 Transcript_90766/m.230952 type:complete len:227 (-) Transcript_90766:1522-2202(-)